MPHYVVFVEDPTLKDDVLIFSVLARHRQQAQRSVLAWYEKNGWPQSGLSFRLTTLRDVQVQHLGHARAPQEVEQIRALCEEVLMLASNEPSIEYGDKLRAMVRSFSIGEQAYRSYYNPSE